MDKYTIVISPSDQSLLVLALAALGGDEAAFLSGMLIDAEPGDVVNDFTL